MHADVEGDGVETSPLRSAKASRPAATSTNESSRRDGLGKRSAAGLAVLLVIVAMVYAGVKILPVRAAAFQFDDAVRDQVLFAASRGSTDAQIMENLLDKAVAVGLPIARRNIEITRPGGASIVIEARYSVTVEMVGGYRYNLSFVQRHEGPAS